MASNYLTAVLAETGLLHLWKLGDDSLDSIGSAHGTDQGSGGLQNLPVHSKLGRLYNERATLFDGTDDTISVGRPADLLTLTSAWSIEALVNIPASANYGFAIFTAEGGSTSVPMSLSVGGNGGARKAEAGICAAPPSDPITPLRSQPGEYWKFVVTTAGTFTFTNTAALVDTYGGLYDSSGTQVASDDDAGGSGRWSFTRALAVGTYYVLHTSYGASSGGAYTLTATASAGGVAGPADGTGTTPPALNSIPVTGGLTTGVPVSSVLEMGGTPVWTYIAGATTLPTDTWMRLLATYDGTNLRIYVNGTLDGTSATILAANVNPPSGVSNFRIARRWDTSGSKPYLPGTLQHVAVYNRALAGSENTDHQNALDSDPLAILELFACPTPPVNAGVEAILLAPVAPFATQEIEELRPGTGQAWPR